MATHGSNVPESVIAFAPKQKRTAEREVDPLDAAARVILDQLNRAANSAETNSQHALDLAHKLSIRLRVADTRIEELEGEVRYHKERADRAERWLYQISKEIEQKFFGSGQ